MYLRFVGAWLVIIGVASYDAYLTVKHQHVMQDVELNPLGRMVLRNEGGVPVLIGLKTAGIALALLFCFGLWQNEAIRRKVLLASYSVAALSLGMIVVMNDDSVRSREVEEYNRSLNAARIARDQLSKQQSVLQDRGLLESSDQLSESLPRNTADWSKQNGSRAAVSPLPVQSTSSAL